MGKSENIKNKNLLFTFIKSFVVTFILSTSILIFFIFHYFGGLKISDITRDIDHLGINKDIDDKYKNNNIVNIAIFGIDSRTNDHAGRSDSIMLLSIDQKHNKLKLISIARDSKVYIPLNCGKYGKYDKYDKINHAYAFGKALLAIKTINKNFGMNIKDYITLNFSEMSAIINAIGGVEVGITENERRDVNQILLSDGYQDTIAKSGIVMLDGNQAMEYSRIRKRDSDNDRMNRQRKIITAIYEKIKAKSYFEYPGLIKKVIPLVETSLSYGDIINLASILKNKPILVEKVFPHEYSNAIGKNSSIDGIWYYEYDLKLATKQLHEFIYEMPY